MSYYSKESLETLRQRIDLVEVVSEHVKMGKSGAAYKGLCPFHEEKTPSFLIHKGDTHYHCFGCGAHGDAISFLMDYVRMSFTDSLEYLSERFQVPLEKVESEEKGPNKSRLKDVCERACLWYRFFLLYAEEARDALAYLYQRGLSLEFIKKFELGYAPKQIGLIPTLLKKEGFSEEELEDAGLTRSSGRGRGMDFFTERVMFPVRDKMGSVIGFSGRKLKEETFGGKYINTPETVLFKKSQVLFGFCYSRQKIAKERKALIVEGQIDALRLIDSGFDYTVAGQGTAFGEGHTRELLQLGVTQVYLALDADRAGKEAAVKIGHLFQAKGVGVTVVALPAGSDPDTFLAEEGKEAFERLLKGGMNYLSFFYHLLCEGQDLSSPSKKSEILEKITTQVRLWEHPVMVHESLRQVANMAGVPEETLGGVSPAVYQMKKEQLVKSFVDPDKVLEMDLLRWMMLSEEKAAKVLEIVRKNISKEDFKVPACAALFSAYTQIDVEKRRDWMAFACLLEKKEEQELLSEILARSINPFKEEEGAVETTHKILLRNWMDRREQINTQIIRGNSSEEEEASLTRQYVELSKRSPEVALPE